jgi:hypothetical protein
MWIWKPYPSLPWLRPQDLLTKRTLSPGGTGLTISGVISKSLREDFVRHVAFRRFPIC